MAATSSRGPGGHEADQRYRFMLFVAGNEMNSRLALENLRLICETHLKGRYELEVIDVFEDYERAHQERVLVTPALIALLPERRVALLGNLSDTKRVLSSLGVGEVQSA